MTAPTAEPDVEPVWVRRSDLADLPAVGPVLHAAGTWSA